MNFTSQSQQYDSAEVQALIKDFEDELDDELKLTNTLDSAAEQKITDATQFLESYSEIIDAQLTRLKILSCQIKDAVAANEDLEKKDQDYTNLIQSQSYIDLSQKIADIYSVSAELVNFLVKKGRRGRPPIN